MKENKTVKRLVALGVSTATAIGGVFLIVPWEGANTNRDGLHIAYNDIGGVPTACYGQTGKDLYGRQITKGMVYTEDECIQMLSKALQAFEKDVDRSVRVDYRSPYQKAAIVSFAYNVGIGAFRSSTLLKQLNDGNHKEACEQLTRWVYVKGKKVKGLENRRNDELQWCLGNVSQSVEEAYKEVSKRTFFGLIMGDK